MKKFSGVFKQLDLEICLHVCRIGVDEWLRVPSVEDVFALGDCAGFLEHTGRQVLPALAQVGLIFSFQDYLV